MGVASWPLVPMLLGFRGLGVELGNELMDPTASDQPPGYALTLRLPVLTRRANAAIGRLSDRVQGCDVSYG